MNFNVHEISEQYNFVVIGASYIGHPVENTVMFITKKVSGLLENLKGIRHCLIFAEEGMNVAESLKDDNCFVFTQNPQQDYALFITGFAKEKEKIDKDRNYCLTEGGYYIGERVQIGEDCYIEPMCLIGHDVVIGNHARIHSGTVIKNAKIGDNFLANENAVIGANGFTMAEDENKDKYRIPTLGKVLIGNNVEVGSHDNISCGSGGDTIIEDNVKLDTQVHIGHDVYLHKNVEITAGAIVGGFVEVGEDSFIGINATLRNRISLGKGSRVSMGAVVTKDVASVQTVSGNFAVDHKRFLMELKDANKKASKTCGGGY